MEITVLGSGTSCGVPLINCNCPVCSSKDSRDKRTRASILVKTQKASIIIDTSTDFRQQVLRENINNIDAIFFTHPHADHVHGIDDLRPFTFEKYIPVYGNSWTIDEIEKRFSYIFNKTQKGGGKPGIILNRITEENSYSKSAININDMSILPIPLKHGNLDVLGFRVRNFAYLTDCSFIPKSSFDMLRDIKYLIIDALREKPHPTHFNFSEAIKASNKIGASKIWFTHLSHKKLHKELTQDLPKGFAPAFDGLKIEI